MGTKNSVWRFCGLALFGMGLSAVNVAAVAIVMWHFSRPPTFWQEKDAMRGRLAAGYQTHTAPHAWIVVQQVSAQGRSVVPVLECLVGDLDPQVRMLAVICLGNIGCKSSVYPLRLALEDWENHPFRTEIVFALAQLGDASALAPLRADWGEHESPPSRMVEALALLGDYSRVPTLFGRLDEEDESTVFRSEWRSGAPCNVLERISGEHFGADPDKWRAWYEKKIKTNPPPEIPEKEIKKWKEIFSKNAETYRDAIEKQKSEQQKKD